MKQPIFILLLLFTCVLGFPLIIHAQVPTPIPGPWYDQNPTQFHERVFGTPLNPVPENEIFGERYTYAQVNWILNSLANIFSLNISSWEDFGELLNTFIGGKIPTFNEYAKLGIPGIMMGSISEIYKNPPATGMQDVKVSLAKLNIIEPAYAQGSTYYHSGALYFLWTASRNTAYLVMVVLLIASGFLIMFRIKINPQTVISLQLMIPKLIMTLVFVTFSFAIAGLVIDSVYLIIAFLLTAFSQSGVFASSNLQRAIEIFTGGNFNLILLYIISPTALTFFASALITGSGFAIASVPILGIVLGLPAVIGGGLFAIFTFIIALAILWILFKLWWMLLKTYIQLMLLIIVGPWQIMLGLLPGQAGFSSWFRNIVANASVFVVTPMMLLFTMVFWSPFTNLYTGIISSFGIDGLTNMFAPLGVINSGGGEYPVLPIVGGGGIIFNFAIGYAILALTPKIADIVRDALKVPAFKYGNAIGESVSSGLGLTGSVVRGGTRLAAPILHKTQGWEVEDTNKFGDTVASKLDNLSKKARSI